MISAKNIINLVIKYDGCDHNLDLTQNQAKDVIAALYQAVYGIQFVAPIAQQTTHQYPQPMFYKRGDER